MNFSWLTMGKDCSHTHQRGLWSTAGNHWWAKTSGSLLSLTLTPTQTHGSLPISLGVNKGKHKTPLFPTALCSRSIFSPADDLFAYPKHLIKYIHQNKDPQGNFCEPYSIQQVTPLQCQFHMSLWESRHGFIILFYYQSSIIYNKNHHIHLSVLEKKAFPIHSYHHSKTKRACRNRERRQKYLFRKKVPYF